MNSEENKGMSSEENRGINIKKKTHGKDYAGIVRDLFIGLFMANSMAVLTGLIGLYINFVFSVTFLLFSCVFIGAYYTMYSIRLSTLFIFTAMLGIAVSASTWEYNVLVSGETIDGIRANMAPQYPDASAFVFTDAIVRSEYMGKTMSQSKETYSFTYVVPLVSPDWTKNEPVPAWAICTEDVDYLSEKTNPPSLLFNTDFKVAVATTYKNSDDAIEDACEKYNLISDKNAPVLRLTYSLEDEIHKAFSLLKWLVLSFNIIWVVVFLIMSLTLKMKDD